MVDSAPTDSPLVSLGQVGERARPIRAPLNEVALVIGLGWTGLNAVAQVRALLQQTVMRRELQTKVRLMAIARRRTLMDSRLLPREERLSLEMETIPWSEVPSEFKQYDVAQWWPHFPRSTLVQQDHWQARVYNRLMLFHNAKLVSETLYMLMKWLREVDPGDANPLPRRIYLLTSLAEAEGGGMLFDVAARLRALTLPDDHTTITGIFSLRARADGDAEDHPSLQMANVYAALREIDSYQLHPATFRSGLPVVVGESMVRRDARPPLDTVLLGDDADSETSEPPENVLAECVATFVAASLVPAASAPSLPPRRAAEPDHERFRGYSIFGVSKLALPVRAAMDLAAVSLAQSALAAVKDSHLQTSPAEWVQSALEAARRSAYDFDLVEHRTIRDQLADWSYNFSTAGLYRKLDARVQRGDGGRIFDIVQSEWAKLERESLGETSRGDAVLAARTDSLRNQMDTILANNLNEIVEQLAASTVTLAYAQGYGLVWTLSAMETLEQKARGLLPRLRQELGEAQAAYQLARTTFFEVAQQHETASTRGRRKGPSPDIDDRAIAALNAFAYRVAVQTKLDAWQDLCQQLDRHARTLREAVPKVDQAIQALADLEVDRRRALTEAAARPPEFPAATVVTADWYQDGTRALKQLSRMTPRGLLGRIYQAWGASSEMPVETQLTRFLFDISQAARRALSGVFAFANLHEFLDQNPKLDRVQSALAALPREASPALTPEAGDRYPPVKAYEIVRHVPRPFSPLNAPRHRGVKRVFVPGSDPDDITVIRVISGLVAESVRELRDAYRRAYDHASADSVPLHIDRRWDSTLADLVQTDMRRRIAAIWHNLVVALERKTDVDEPFSALVSVLGEALSAQGTTYDPDLPSDLRMVIYDLRPLQLKLPPPQCKVIFLFSQRPADVVAQDLYTALTQRLGETPFALVVNVLGRRDIDQILDPLRQNNFTVLDLNEADLKRLVTAQLPIRALIDLVLNRVKLFTVSPFYTQGPVPDNMFFGRDSEIGDVMDKLRTHSVLLIGGRRIGKTSTLQRIQRRLKANSSQYDPYYLDSYQIQDYHSFFYRIRRNWQVPIRSDASPVEFETVIDVLRKRSHPKQVVLLFDEVDRLLEFDRDRSKGNSEILFRTFRSLSQEGACRYVFSGEKWLMAAMSDSYSGLFNFAKEVRLKPLPKPVVHQLVAQPFQDLNIWLERADEIIDRIYDISAGHPNIVQIICTALIRQLDQDEEHAHLISYRHLERAVDQHELQQEIALTIWGQMTPLAKMVTLIWPENKRALSLDDINLMVSEVGAGGVSRVQMERTARNLELYCFVQIHNWKNIELIPRAFPSLLAIMTDKTVEIQQALTQFEKQRAEEAAAG